MDSIIQDFGEIPEDYLEPAGDGGYTSDIEEEEETNNNYENQNYDFVITNGIMLLKNIEKIGAN